MFLYELKYVYIYELGSKEVRKKFWVVKGFCLTLVSVVKITNRWCHFVTMIFSLDLRTVLELFGHSNVPVAGWRPTVNWSRGWSFASTDRRASWRDASPLPPIRPFRRSQTTYIDAATMNKNTVCMKKNSNIIQGVQLSAAHWISIWDHNWTNSSVKTNSKFWSSTF